MDREDYITNIRAYWQHSQKAPSTSKVPNTASSLPPAKSRQSKLSAASSQPHAHDQYGIDYDGYENDDEDDKDDDDDDDDDDDKPRSKGKSRQAQNEWDDECHKDTRHKGKNHTADNQYEIDYNDT